MDIDRKNYNFAYEILVSNNFCQQEISLSTPEHDFYNLVDLCSKSMTIYQIVYFILFNIAIRRKFT